MKIPHLDFLHRNLSIYLDQKQRIRRGLNFEACISSADRTFLSNQVQRKWAHLLVTGIWLLSWFGASELDRPYSAAPPSGDQPPASQSNTNDSPMVLIPAGTFVMGDDGGDPDERPAHKVTVSAFYIDTHEVTQGAYTKLTRQNPSKFRGLDKPVDQVDWYHAALFCNNRSRKEGLKPCYDPKTLVCDFQANGYRLPTEAEWEYACRAAQRGKFSFGDQPEKLKNHGWFKENSLQTTHAVGQKGSNPWGLFDMHGNAAEWCNDIYSDSYYRTSPIADPHGPDKGDKRVLRGGSWNSTPDSCRASARNSEAPRLADACFGSDTYGFRCVKAAR